MNKEKASTSLINDGVNADDLEVFYQADVRYAGRLFKSQ